MNTDLTYLRKAINYFFTRIRVMVGDHSQNYASIVQDNVCKHIKRDNSELANTLKKKKENVIRDAQDWSKSQSAWYLA